MSVSVASAVIVAQNHFCVFGRFRSPHRPRSIIGIAPIRVIMSRGMVVIGGSHVNSTCPSVALPVMYWIGIRFVIWQFGAIAFIVK